MKLEFKTLTIKNFISYGNNPQVFEFSNNGIKLIKGINKDKSEDDTRFQNGLGKTSFMHALHYALFGTAVGNVISLSGLVNNINRKHMEVALDFNIDEQPYRIERGHNPNYLRFYKGDTEYVDESLGDSRETQDVITKLVGVTPELFCQTILLSCKVESYVNQKLDVRRNIIEQVLGFNAISDKVEKLKRLIKEQKLQIEQATFEYETKRKANDTLRATLNNQYELISQQAEDWETNRANQIKSKEESIKQLSSIDFDKEIKLINDYADYLKAVDADNQLITMINNYTAQISNCSEKIGQYEEAKHKLEVINVDEEKEKFAFNDKVKEQQQKLNEIRIHNASVKQQEIMHQSKLTQLEKELETLNMTNGALQKSNCPYCGAPMKNTKEMLEQNEEEIRAKKQAIVEVKALLIGCNEDYKKEPKVETLKETAFKDISDLMNVMQQIITIDNEILKEKTNIETFENNIKECNDKLVKPTEPVKSSFNSIQEVETLRASLNQETSALVELKANKENPFNTQIKQLTNDMMNIEEVKNDLVPVLELELQHQEMLLKLLNDPKSSVRQAILDKSIAFLNQKVKEYLIKLDSPIFVEFKSDMSVSMYNNGLEISSPSSGEEGRIALALQFAFRDTWECLNGIHPNILMVDEVIDRSGLDEAGVSAVINCLTSLNDRGRYVVSHNPIVANAITDSIMIIKKGNFSFLNQ